MVRVYLEEKNGIKEQFYDCRLLDAIDLFILYYDVPVFKHRNIKYEFVERGGIIYGRS